MNTIFNDPVYDFVFAAAIISVAIFVIHKVTKKIDAPKQRFKLTEEEELIAKQRGEDYDMERAINYRAMKMMHYYTHGEPVYQFPITKSYTIFHKPTAKYLGVNVDDLVLEEFNAEKLKHDIEHGPVLDKFQASLKKPNLL